jgi:hypothetical protein
MGYVIVWTDRTGSARDTAGRPDPVSRRSQQQLKSIASQPRDPVDFDCVPLFFIIYQYPSTAKNNRLKEAIECTAVISCVPGELPRAAT